MSFARWLRRHLGNGNARYQCVRASRDRVEHSQSSRCSGLAAGPLRHWHLRICLAKCDLERATASDAASVNETADMLLESAGQWARERGATNLTLNAADPATEAQKAAIANFRKLGDRPFEQALVRMSERHFANKDQMISGAKRAHDQLAALRARADTEIAKPAGARDKTVSLSGLRPSPHSSQRARLSVSRRRWRRMTSSLDCRACRSQAFHLDNE